MGILVRSGKHDTASAVSLCLSLSLSLWFIPEMITFGTQTPCCEEAQTCS